MKLAQFLTGLVVMVYICGLMVFTNLAPAIAAQSSLNKGLEQLPNIQTKAEDVTKADPYSNKPEYGSNQGLNEVQGTADFDKMKRGANGDTLPAVLQVDKAFDQVGDNIKSAKDDTQNSINSNLNKAGNKAGDAANYVKDKAEDVLQSVTGKAADTADSIKDGTKSLINKSANKLRK